MRFITSKPLKPSIKFAPLIIKRKHKRTKTDEKILLSIRVFKKGISIFKILIGKKNDVVSELDVWQGKQKTVKAYISSDIYKTIPKAKKKYLKVTVNYEGPIEAPIEKNEVIGKMKITYKDEVVGNYDLFASESVQKQNIISRILSSINFLIWGDV